MRRPLEPEYCRDITHRKSRRDGYVDSRYNVPRLPDGILLGVPPSGPTPRPTMAHNVLRWNDFSWFYIPCGSFHYGRNTVLVHHERKGSRGWQRASTTPRPCRLGSCPRTDQEYKTFHRTRKTFPRCFPEVPLGGQRFTNLPQLFSVNS